MEEKAAGEQVQAPWKDGSGRERRVRLGRTKRDGQLRFEELKFDNLALRALPIDSIQDNYPRQVRTLPYPATICVLCSSFS